MIAQAPAAQVYASLKRSLATIEREHKNSVLYFADILGRRLYRDLDYSSIWHLAREGLGFSKTRTAQYIRLAKAVDRLPRLKQAVASGEVEWTKARELTRIANPKNEAAWVARAKKRSRRQLQAEVPTTHGARKLGRAPAAAVACDHNAVGASGSNRSAIPIRLRRQVLARDRHRCSAPGCTHTRFLHIHHRIKRED